MLSQAPGRFLDFFGYFYAAFEGKHHCTGVDRHMVNRSKPQPFIKGNRHRLRMLHAVVRNKAGRKIKYKINRRPSQMKKLSKSGQYAAKKAERSKSSVRAKVEHVFGVVKKQLRFRKTRYRGLEKQQAKFNIMFALANLILADGPCLAAWVSAPLRTKKSEVIHSLYSAPIV